jgi:hypothetical protein
VEERTASPQRPVSIKCRGCHEKCLISCLVAFLVFHHYLYSFFFTSPYTRLDYLPSARFHFSKVLSCPCISHASCLRSSIHPPINSS